MNVYVIAHKESGKAYVGQARNVHKRIYEHLRTAHESSSLIARAIHKYGVDAFTVSYVPLPEGSSRELLNEMEVRVIAHLNTRHPSGYNLAAGGYTVDHHPDSVEKIRRSKLGKPRSAETRAAVSAAMKASPKCRGWKMTPEQVEALRQSRKGQVVTAEQREKMRQAWVRRKAEGRGTWTTTPEQRARMSAAQKARPPKSEETKAKLSAALKGRQLSQETRAKMSASRKGQQISPGTLAALIGRVCSPETRAKIAAKKRERDANQTPEQREAMLQRMRAYRPTEDTKANMRAAQQRRWARVREAQTA